MSSTGKESTEFMKSVVYANLGKRSPSVRLGPGTGLDIGVLRVNKGTVMILTADPISAVPAFGMALSAWLSVNLIASDFTTSGRDPQYATFAYNFPQSMPSTEREEYIHSIGRECKNLGIAIVGGHTGSYPGGGFTVIGAGSMFGFSPEGRFVSTAMARVDDRIMMTKHAAIEATGSLALSFPRFLEQKIGPKLLRRSCGDIRLCSTVRDARIARMVGLGKAGITSMHDATEGGILGALDEMAKASGKSFEINLDDVPVSGEAKAVCEAFGIDPLESMGEGALLITCTPGAMGRLEKLLNAAQIGVRQIGTVKPGSGLWVSFKGGRRSQFRPGPDGYWKAYEKAIDLGLR